MTRFGVDFGRERVTYLLVVRPNMSFADLPVCWTPLPRRAAKSHFTKAMLKFEQYIDDLEQIEIKVDKRQKVKITLNEFTSLKTEKETIQNFILDCKLAISKI